MQRFSVEFYTQFRRYSPLEQLPRPGSFKIDDLMNTRLTSTIRIMAHSFVTIVLLLLYSSTISASPVASRTSNITEFIILHNNDIHSRFEQANKNGGVCTKEEADADKCFGGFARIAHELRKYREEANNGGAPVLYLNAGDTFSGTSWFLNFKDNITSSFLNKLQPDAMCIGNHEFDLGIKGLITFLNAVNFPVVASNLDLSNEPELLATNKLRNSTILHLNGTKVAVIGYLTPKTKQDYKNNVEFNEEIVSINAEAERIRELGVNIIIALGHSGYQKDQEIAKNCPEVDIVIGGHSHTYLDSSQPVADKDDSNPEAVRGPYPTIVTQPSGKKVPVVQAYMYSKYLGKLHVQFDGEGNLIEFDGSPILLNASIGQEQDILNLLNIYRANLTAKQDEVIGYTKVYLEGGRICRHRECNMGNLITDSMVNARVNENKGGAYWTDAAIALIMGGGIRTSVEKKTDGSITLKDMADTIPFANRLNITRVTGKTLLNALEHSAAVKGSDSDGGFLQLSGVHVVYDFEKEKGNRVVSAHVRCAECYIPTYSNINETAYYKVIVPEFILNGGDGFNLIELDNPLTEPLEKNDMAALREYLKDHKFVMPEIEGRIIFSSSK